MSVKASWGKLCADSSNLIICGLSSCSLARILRFLANPPNYFKFRFSIFNKKDVLWLYPGSIITIPG